MFASDSDETPRRGRWEYRVVVLSAGWSRGGGGGLDPRFADRAETQLDDLGRDGWEAVNIEICADFEAVVLLKRPIQDVPPALETVGVVDVSVEEAVSEALEEAERVLNEGD